MEEQMEADDDDDNDYRADVSPPVDNSEHFPRDAGHQKGRDDAVNDEDGDDFKKRQGTSDVSGS
jgi:hypothetical protein